MKKNFRNFQEKLLEDLKNPKLAKAYLNEALIDEDPRMFLLALKNVFEAQDETMTDIAEKSQLSRENIYRILSPKGNPKITSIISLLHAAGFSLAVQPTSKKSKK